MTAGGSWRGPGIPDAQPVPKRRKLPGVLALSGTPAGYPEAKKVTKEGVCSYIILVGRLDPGDLRSSTMESAS